MKRRKLTKKERALLWYDADGKCKICGIELPDDWHADHIEPFSQTGRTNVHEMQALCPECNIRKGSMKFRKHQQEMIDICQQILAGSPIARIIASVTPGGGKSALPVILVHYLIPILYEKFCWVVPRINLREQGDESFVDPLFRRLLGHNNTIMQSTNDANPSRGTQGFITTYQAISTDNHELAREFQRRKYILFLDEPHHVYKGSSYEKGLQPLVDRAGLIVFASGTLDRHDNVPLSFLPYVKNEFGLLEVDMKEYNDKRVITYSRADALREGAISELEFILSDARAEWLNPDGSHSEITSFEDEDSDKGLKSALRTEYAFDLIDKMLEHYQSHKSIFRPAQALIIAPNVSTGKVYHEHVKNEGFSCDRVDYTKKESENTGIIKRFKKGKFDVLVTVAIAYEGLDVPNITHLSLLTHYRSKQWIAQSVARAARRPNGKTRGFVFAPDDPSLNKIIEDIKQEQLEAAVPFGDPIWEPKDDGLQPELSPRSSIIPLSSSLTGTRAQSEYNSITQEQYALVREVKNHIGGIAGVSDVQLHEAIVHAEQLKTVSLQQKHEIGFSPVTPTNERRKLLKEIDNYTRQLDKHKFDEEWGKTNRLIYSAFRKGRQDMTNAELKKVWQWLNKTYPLNY